MLRRQLNRVDPKLLFFVGLLVSASGIISPPIALAAGLCFGFLFIHPLRSESGRLAKLLLQLSVVALGFGMNLFQILKVGSHGFVYTAVSITASLALGLLLGRLARVKGKASALISVGTAICGGSAIAAVAPILDANEDDISVSMGTVFVLNSVALFVFPAIGAALHLTQNQFGLWAALAIHDTSSVVGACAKYGGQALVVGTTVKLARALWIIPVSLVTAVYWRAEHKKRHPGAEGKTRVAIPWFIFFFCLASVLRTYTGRFSPFYDTLAHLGKTGLTATLFLIGTGLSRATLRQVGFRPFLQGLILWLVVATASLFAIYHAGLIH